MSGKIVIDTINVGSAALHESGDNVVFIQYFSGKTFVFAHTLTPADARTIAADLIERADYCDGLDKQANEVAAKFLAKYQAQEH